MVLDRLQHVQEPVVVRARLLGPELPPNSLTITGRVALAFSILSIQASTLSPFWS